MSLTRCPDCSTEHSDQAKACPKCARPAQPSMLRREAESAVKVAKGAVAGFIILVLLLVGFLTLATLFETLG